MRVLVTGGAGFVGANLSVRLAARHPDWEFVAFDNLRRRGSELNLVRLKEAAVQFVHGDVREPADLMALQPVDVIIECSAEPSVLAGVHSGLDYLIRTNLLGAYHCLELARRLCNPSWLGNQGNRCPSCRFAARRNRRSDVIPISTYATQSVTISASVNRLRALPGREGSRSSAVQ